MSLTKVTYTDGESVIHSQNLNDIQDEIISNASSINEKQYITDSSLTTTDKTITGAINELNTKKLPYTGGDITGNLTIAGSLYNNSLRVLTTNDLDTIYSFDIAMTDLSTTWTDVEGINHSTLPSGVYVVDYWGLCHTNYTWQVNNNYTGIMYWYAGGTNASEASEITLHTGGHAHNGQLVKLRTLQHASSYMTFQICVTGGTFSGTAHFKFRKLF